MKKILSFIKNMILFVHEQFVMVLSIPFMSLYKAKWITLIISLAVITCNGFTINLWTVIALSIAVMALFSKGIKKQLLLIADDIKTMRQVPISKYFNLGLDIRSMTIVKKAEKKYMLERAKSF